MRTPYPADVSADEWAVVPYLALLREAAVQRRYDLPPWDVVYQQERRWLDIRVFGASVSVPRRRLQCRGHHLRPPSRIPYQSRTRSEEKSV